MGSDGFVLGWDEYYRHPGPLLDIYLELVENSVAQVDGGPSVTLDAVRIASSNDESLADALKKGRAKASVDRSKAIPWRQPVNPREAMKVLFVLQDQSKFRMRDLSKKDAKLEEFDLNTAFPAPTDAGQLETPEGRYAIYWMGNEGGEPVLIAPRTLELMAYTFAASHFERDPSKNKEAMAELGILRETPRFITNPVTRLKILLGELQVEAPVRGELKRYVKLAGEGQHGMMARFASEWFGEALMAAAKPENHNTLTPGLASQVFVNMLDTIHKDQLPGMSRPELATIHQEIKASFSMRDVMRDVRSIMAGGDSRVDAIYDQVKREIFALHQNPTEVAIREPSGKEVPINQKRLDEIKKIYKEQSGRDLHIGEITFWHINQQSTDARNDELLAAIEQYVLTRQFDLGGTEEIVSAMDGDATTSSAVRSKLSEMSRAAEKLGYNEVAFREALRFVRDHQNDIELKKRKGQE
jgi:hypothetical protein